MHRAGEQVGIAASAFPVGLGQHAFRPVNPVGTAIPGKCGIAGDQDPDATRLCDTRGIMRDGYATRHTEMPIDQRAARRQIAGKNKRVRLAIRVRQSKQGRRRCALLTAYAPGRACHLSRCIVGRRHD